MRQEDKVESDGDGSKMSGQKSKDDENAASGGPAASASVSSRRSGDTVKKKRLSGSADRDHQLRNKDGSSGLSSAPTSPRSQQQKQQQRQHHTQKFSMEIIIAPMLLTLRPQIQITLHVINLHQNRPCEKN